MLDQTMGSFICRQLLSLERQRLWWLKRAPAGPLRDYYQVPFANPTSPSAATDYLAVDIETTGLSPQHDELLSIGFVPIAGHGLQLTGAQHYLVRPERAIPESSAVVHGILDDRARLGRPIAEALPPLLKALTGRVLVAHSARIEYDFLDIACRRLYGCSFVTPFVDTLELEQRKILRSGSTSAPGALRLDALRQQYGLPRYRAHDALSDAIGAGELLLAQIAHRTTKRPLKLEELTRTY